MPSKLADGARRVDAFALDPTKITCVEALRGRRFPPTAEQIQARAESLLRHGQEQPVRVQKIDGVTHLVSGFTRVAAACLIRAGFTDSDGVYQRDEEFEIRAMVQSCADDTDALVHNIISNLDTNACTDVDNAHNQQALRVAGWPDTDIAKLYRCTPAGVSRLKKLLLVSEEIQKKVHAGLMATEAALDTLDLPADKVTEVVAAATKDNGKVAGAKVRDAVREQYLAAHESVDSLGAQVDEHKPITPATEAAPVAPKAPAVTSGPKQRNVREVREFFESHKSDCPEVRDFCAKMVEFIKGSRGSASVGKALEKIAAAEMATA